MRQDALSVVLLAGGRSRRLGRDKAFLTWEGAPLVNLLVERFRQAGYRVLVAGGPAEWAARLGDPGAPVLPDPAEHAGQGPLAGLAAGLRAAAGEAVGLVACDLPLASPAALALLHRALAAAGRRAAVPVLRGRAQPLHGVYAGSLLPLVEERLRGRDRSLRGLLAEVDTLWVGEAELREAGDPELFLLDVDGDRDGGGFGGGGGGVSGVGGGGGGGDGDGFAPSSWLHHPSGLTHLDGAGRVRMVDVGGKEPTRRVAVARGEVRMRPARARLLAAGALPKGDALAVARVAGIMAAKKAADLVPLCHPLPLTAVHVAVEVEPDAGRVLIEARVEAVARTGVEMEALAAVTGAALAVYDMAKAVDRDMVIGEVRLVEKAGGRSGVYRRPGEPPASAGWAERFPASTGSRGEAGGGGAAGRQGEGADG